MRETLLVTLMAAGLAALAALGRMPLGQAVLVGGWLIGGGLVVGVPAGVLYHVQLRRELARAGGVPRGWIWRPTELHAVVPEHDRMRFLPSFWLGAVACGVVFFGCAVVFIAAMSDLVRFGR